MAERNERNMAEVFDRRRRSDAVVQIRDYPRIDSLTSRFKNELLHQPAVFRRCNQNFVDEMAAHDARKIFDLSENAGIAIVSPAFGIRLNCSILPTVQKAFHY